MPDPTESTAVEAVSSGPPTNDEKATAVGLTGFLISEAFFIFLPILVIVIVQIHSDRSREIIYAPEWAFISATILGQSITRVATSSTAAALAGRKVVTHNFAAVIAGLIVLGLVPALLLLTLSLLTDKPSLAHAVWQLLIFVVAVVAYLLSSAHWLQVSEGKNR